MSSKANPNAPQAASENPETKANPSKPRKRPVTLDGERLTRRMVLDVARRGRKVVLDAGALKRVTRCATFLANKLKQGEPIYGVTTGFGSNADRLLGSERGRPHPDGSGRGLVEELQRNLIISHAVGVGAALPVELVRAMLLIRINTLLSGHSGVRATTVKLMVELLNRGITPVVPEKGSVGASGDLAPLAHLALPLLGEGEVDYQGHRMHAAQALAEEGLVPIALSSKEGLALTNGTAQMLATAVLALDELAYLIKAADLNAALVVEAFCGRSAAFDARAHELRPHPGQISTAANLRALLADSSLVDIDFHRVPRFAPWTPTSWGGGDEASSRTFDIRWDYVLPSERHGPESFYQKQLPFRGGKKMQPQDAYCLRCIPQVHGAIKDAYAQACRVIDIELNAVTDNPLVFPRNVSPDDEFDPTVEETVISAGNFHGMPLALVMSYVKSCIPVLASIAERRIAKLTDPATNDGLPPFLIGNEDGTDSGLMIVQYSAAALVNDLATRAHPACVYSVPTSANTEDHVSMGTNEIRQVYEMTADLRRVLALELFTATQALEYRVQVLNAANAVASHMGTLRAKIRNISPVRPEQTTALAADIKALQEDLKRLAQVHPSPISQRVLGAVRAAGIAFVARDRLLKPDLDRCEALLESRELVRLVEHELGVTLEVD